MRGTIQVDSVKGQSSTLTIHLTCETIDVEEKLIYWIKTWGGQVGLPTNSQRVEVMEIDEMHTYIQSKKLLLDMECC